MKNIRKTATIAALAISIGSVAVGYAQTRDAKNSQTNERAGERAGRRPDMPPPGHDGFNPRMLDQLNVTDAQKEQIHALMENSRTASREQFDKIRGFDEQLRTLVQADSFNEEQARQLLTAKSQATIELDIARLRTDSAIYNILTTEQKSRLKQLKQERPEFGPRGDGFRPGAPPPPEN